MRCLQVGNNIFIRLNEYKKVFVCFTRHSQAKGVLEVRASMKEMTENYSMNSTSSDTLQQLSERLRGAELIRENIDASKSSEEIARIRAARERRVSDLIQAQRYASNPDDVAMMRNRISAAKMGLPEDTSPKIIQETRAKLFRQSEALLQASGQTSNSDQD